MTKQFSNYSDLLTFTRASKGHALRPVSYGDELVTNGTFDSDTSGWTSSSAFTATLNQSAGELSVTSTGNYGRALQAITCEIGKIYSLTCDVTEVGTTALVVVAIASSGTVNNAVFLKNDITSTQTVTAIFVATQQTHYVSVGNQDVNTGVTSKFDNISVKEVLFDQPDGTLTLFEHPENIPRVEYDADGNRLGLLVEELRTNLITDSSGASSDDATSGSSQTPNQTNSLTGLDDAFLVQATNTGTSYRGQRISVTSGTSYAASRFIKAGTTNFAQISMGTDGFGTNVYANFDLSNGTVATESNCDASITEMGGGWYRCSITKAATNTTSGTSPHYFTPVASGTSAIRVATSGDNVYQFGAQTEAGSFPTSYIKTTGNTKDRAADVAKIPVADFGYNTAVGSVVAQYTPTKVNGDVRGVFEIAASTTSNRAYHSASEENHWLVRSEGATPAAIDIGTVSENANKVAAVYKKDDFAVSVNGASVGTDTSGNVPTSIIEMNIGALQNGFHLNGHIKSIKYYPRRLTNAQLQDITS